jgi:hypothetical protein
VAQEKSRRCNKKPQTGEPVPLCAYHQRKLLKIQLNGVDAETITADLANHIVASWYDFNTEGGIDREALVAVARERRAKYEAERDQRIAELEKKRDDREANSVVYFIAMGEKIKIGTTLGLKKRVRGLSLPESAVLATEPGGPRRERQLHGQFAQLREHGEWFRADPELLAYIDTLKATSDATSP